MPYYEQLNAIEVWTLACSILFSVVYCVLVTNILVHLWFQAYIFKFILDNRPSLTFKFISKKNLLEHNLTSSSHNESIIWSTRYNAKNNNLLCYSKWRENALFNNAYEINMLLFVCINQFMPLLPRTNGNVLFSSSSLCILSSACMKRIAIAINVVPWTQYTTQCWKICFEK